MAADYVDKLSVTPYQLTTAVITVSGRMPIIPYLDSLNCDSLYEQTRYYASGDTEDDPTAQSNEKKAFTGHIGTHFDVMNKVFPLDYTERDAIVFDVPTNGQGETTPGDIDLSLICEGMFVAFRSGFIESEGYGSAVFFREHPTLSMTLINVLLDRRVSIIGVDFAALAHTYRNGCSQCGSRTSNMSRAWPAFILSGDLIACSWELLHFERG